MDCPALVVTRVGYRGGAVDAAAAGVAGYPEDPIAGVRHVGYGAHDLDFIAFSSCTFSFWLPAPLGWHIQGRVAMLVSCRLAHMAIGSNVTESPGADHTGQPTGTTTGAPTGLAI